MTAMTYDINLREQLLEKAREVREKAYVPYSHFKVGAALCTESGEVYTGANIENASYGLSCCAERVALFTAAAHGMKHIHMLLVIADTDTPVSMCGACRQVTAEFATEKTSIICTTLKKTSYKIWSMGELLPQFFNRTHMNFNA